LQNIVSFIGFLLQKRLIILRSLLIVATTYSRHLDMHSDKTGIHYNTLQHTATHIYLTQNLWHNPSSRIQIQHTATHCNTLQDIYIQNPRHVASCAIKRNTLQHAATHCNTLQHTATHIYLTENPWHIASSRHRDMPRGRGTL